MTAMHTWDPDRYLTYADERGRPFVELLARVGAEPPATVVDLGCGPGNLTGPARPALAGGRRARPGLEPRDDRQGPRDHAGHRLRGRRPARLGCPPTATRSTCSSPTPPCSGCPATSTCCRALVSRVRPGGWFAFQVPGNFDEPSHTIRDRARRRGAVRRAHRRRGRAELATTRPSTSTPSPALGCDVDAWETTYLHVLTARTRSSPGSPAPAPGRPSRRCRTGCAGEFEEEFKRRLRAAYPEVPARRRAAVPPDLRGGPGAGMRLHHVQVACPPGGEDAARRFYADGLGPDRGREAGGAARPRRRLVPRVRRRRRGRRRAARRRRGPVRPGAQGASGVPASTTWTLATVPAQAGPASRWTSGSGRRSRGTCASTPSTRTATGSRSCRPSRTLDEQAVGLLVLLVALAPELRGHHRAHLFDVVTAAGPRDLAAGTAPHGTTHGPDAATSTAPEPHPRTPSPRARPSPRATGRPPEGAFSDPSARVPILTTHAVRGMAPEVGGLHMHASVTRLVRLLVVLAAITAGAVVAAPPTTAATPPDANDGFETVFVGSSVAIQLTGQDVRRPAAHLRDRDPADERDTVGDRTGHV